MAIVDEKGRLFGKVNLLDLVVVLAVLAVAARFGYANLKGKQATPTGQDKTIEVTMKFGAVAQPTIDALPVGTDVFDSKSNTFIGKVVEVRSQPALVVTQTEDGRLFETASRDRFDFYTVVAGPGRISPNGITMNGIEIKIGRTNYLKSALWAGYGVTWTINQSPKR